VVEAPLEEGIDVWEALGHLSASERAAVFLTYWEDLSEADTALRLGANERTVRRWLARARAKLGRLLHE
jgi:RNA polymerase sigma factor (sigma-70 family)